MATIGIDLGTTNSLVSVWTEEGAKLIPNGLGDFLTPSAVSILEDESIIVGKPARDRLITHPQRTASMFKRDMGTKKIYRLAKKNFLPEELSSLILAALKEDAEHFLGEKVHEAVISVPAYFNDSQRQATKNAGALAGLEVKRIINEPTAGAIAYGLHEEYEQGTFIVLDLGGGTFDVSILEFFDGVMEVHAVAGDNRLGGEDFTKAIVEQFIDSHGLDERDLSPTEIETLRSAAEECKFTLTKRDSYQGKRTIAEKELDFTLNKLEFASRAESLLERLSSPITRAIRDADIQLDEIDDIVLVGGATRMPIFKDMIYSMFKRFPNTSLNPDEIVAMGAAVQAGLKDKALKDVILTDVCPYTLGTEVADERNGVLTTGHFLPIIERNTTVPVSRSASNLATVQDNQSEINIRVYQGEHRKVENNIFLGELRIRIPRKPKGEVRVELRYTYDINGILEVEAGEQDSDVRKRIIIEENPGSMSAEEIQKRFEKLQHLKVHPRDQLENQALLERGERLYQEFVSLRAPIEQALKKFESDLATQDLDRIEKARTSISEFFDQIDRDIF
jgi:molecular chaperone HscC